MADGLLSTEVGSSTNYLTADHLGSPRINTDGSGNVVARHDYMPFGEEITSSQRTTGAGHGSVDAVRKQFTGYEMDSETNLNFAQARYQQSSVGRFLSPDPLLASAERSDPQSWNRYVYVRNNPTILVDPSGLIWGSKTIGDTTYFCFKKGSGVCKGFSPIDDDTIVPNATINGNKVGDIRLLADGSTEHVLQLTLDTGKKVWLNDKDWGAIHDAAGGALCSVSMGIACPEAVQTETNISGNVKVATDAVQMAFMIKGLLKAGVTLGAIAMALRHDKADIAKIAAKVIGQGYKTGDCLQCVQDLMQAFEKEGIKGEVVMLSSEGGNAIVKAGQKGWAGLVSEAGTGHYGVKVGNYVYEMNSTTGIPISKWASMYETLSPSGKVTAPIVSTVPK